MKVAIPVWGNKISPVFETAEHLLVLDMEDGIERNRELLHFGEPLPLWRIHYLLSLGVNLVVCGAISKEFEMSLDSNQIKVIPFICGQVEQIITALTKGDRLREMFGMPGRQEF